MRCCRVGGHAEQLAIEIEQALAGMIVGEAMIFGQIADAGADVDGAGRFVEQRRLALPAAGDAEQDLDERGLAGPVLAEQAVDFALFDLERDPAESLDASVTFAQIPVFQQLPRLPPMIVVQVL